MDNRTAKIIAIIMCLITAACLAAAVVLSSEGFTKGAADTLSVIASVAAGTKGRQLMQLFMIKMKSLLARLNGSEWILVCFPSWQMSLLML